jgi:hypothetical protein
MSVEKDTYAVVVLGGMNPRIHHPSWYRLVGLFDQKEAELATQSPLMVITPPVSVIKTQTLTISCQEMRWEISTSEPAEVQRIQEITARLFDDILVHTPVSTIGFNFNYRRVTIAPDVARCLASVLVNVPLGLKAAHATSGELILRRTFDDHTALVNVQPASDDKQTVLSFYNFEYHFKHEGFFKMGDVIAKRYGVDKDESEEQTKLIVAAIDHLSRD